MRLDEAAAGVPTKALLPLGSRTVIERVVSVIRDAGIEDIVVVTGHACETLTPVLDVLKVRHVYNPQHLTGMFSSVRAGVAALDSRTRAFFVLPVDYALVGPDVFREMARQWDASEPRAAIDDGTVLHPTCCGRRGHPPLLAAGYGPKLLGADGSSDGLRGVLRAGVRREKEVEVEDLAILIDMDTPEDYQRVARFARTIDSPSYGGIPPDDSRYLRSLLQPSEQLVAHTELVATIGLALGRAVHEHLPEIDLQLVHSACLLHDLAKGTRKHSAVGRRLLDRLGLPGIAAIVDSHMVMPSERLESPVLTEEQIVYLADKLVIGDRFVGLAAKSAHTIGKHRGNPEGVESAKLRMQTAALIAGRVEALLGRSLEAVILEPKAADPL